MTYELATHRHFGASSRSIAVEAASVMSCKNLVLVFLTTAVMAGCGGGGGGSAAGSAPAPAPAPVSTAKSSTKSLTSLSVAGVDATIDESTRSITASVPAGTDVASLVASFVSSGASVSVAGVSQTSGVTVNDFTNSLSYRVTAQDGSSADYRVQVTVLPSASKAFTYFALTGGNPSPSVGVIDEASHSIAVSEVAGTSTQSLGLSFKATGTAVTNDGNGVSNGEQMNFASGSLTFAVLAADGTRTNYSVGIKTVPSSEKRLSQILLATTDQIGSYVGGAYADETQKSVSITVPYGTPVKSLYGFATGTGTFSVNGVVQPYGKIANDYTAPVTWLVTAADGSSVGYLATVIVAAPVVPTVSFTVPGDQMVANGLSAPILVGFNRPLDASTCNSSSLTLVPSVPGTVVCDYETLRFTPSAPMSASATYTATVATSVKDVDGLGLSQPAAWSFTTRSDYVPPTVVGSSESGSVFKLEMSEPVNVATVNTASIVLSPSAAGVVKTDGLTASFTATSPLAKGVQYTVTVNGIQDLAGNPMASPYLTTFATDPGQVTPMEYYAGGGCGGTYKAFSVAAQNDTGFAQDIRICINNAALGYSDCSSYSGVQPGTHTPVFVNSNDKNSYSPAMECYSTGQYVVTATRTGTTAPVVSTPYASSVWVPNAPVVDPCFVSGSITAPNCVSKLSVSPTPAQPTSSTSGTLPSASLGSETSPDTDGCYVPQHHPECLVIEKQAYSVYEPTMLILRLRNTCARRVYANFCNQRTDGSWDCGADGVSSGGALSWTTYGANGKSEYDYTGSTKWENDWVCASKDKNFPGLP